MRGFLGSRTFSVKTGNVPGTAGQVSHPPCRGPWEGAAGGTAGGRGTGPATPRALSCSPRPCCPWGGARGPASTPGRATEQSLSCPTVTRASSLGSRSPSFRVWSAGLRSHPPRRGPGESARQTDTQHLADDRDGGTSGSRVRAPLILAPFRAPLPHPRDPQSPGTSGRMSAALCSLCPNHTDLPAALDPARPPASGPLHGVSAPRGPFPLFPRTASFSSSGLGSRAICTERPSSSIIRRDVCLPGDGPFLSWFTVVALGLGRCPEQCSGHTGQWMEEPAGLRRSPLG